MLIESDIRKLYGVQPGEPIYGPEVQRYLIVDLSAPDLAPGGGASPWYTLVTIVDPVTGETQTVVIGFSASPSGSTTISTQGIIDLVSEGAVGALALYRMTAVIADAQGSVYENLGTDIVWLPRSVPYGATAIPFDTITGQFQGYTPSVQTNTPGWDGQALSIDSRAENDAFRYSFSPQATVPFFTGLINDNVTGTGTNTVLPSRYIAAFEVSGPQATCWVANSPVHGPFSWTDGDRFHILYVDGAIKFFQNATELWSS